MRSQVVDLVEKYLGRGHYSGEDNISLRCPFHKGGQEHRPSFSINVTNGAWQCFTCHVTGSLPKLLRLLGLPKHAIDAALKDLRDDFQRNRERLDLKKRTQWVGSDPFLAPTILPEVTLKPYEFCPLKLVNAGFNEQWLEWMDIGFDRINNRITYPIRDIYGNLAGISGGATIAGQTPKYKVYEGGHKDPQTGKQVPSDFGPWFDEQYPNYYCWKSHFLWNIDNVYPRLFFGDDTQTLIIVEGFKACLWLLQAGWTNTVALMGSALSDQQCSILHRFRANVVLFLDNDEPGRKGTNRVAKQLLRFTPGVFIAHYPYADDAQPDDLSPAEITASIQGSIPYPQWRKERAP